MSCILLTESGTLKKGQAIGSRYFVEFCGQPGMSIPKP